MENNEALLRAIFMTLGRGIFPPTKLLRIVAPREDSKKMLVAYNACDGNASQAEIARKAKIDKGALSRALARWVEAGVVVRIGRDQVPLHIYPLTPAALEEGRE